MDVRLTTQQVDALYNKVKSIKVNGGNPIYTDINKGYHFSWQANKAIVVGEDAKTKRHRTFTATITKQFGVAIGQGAGAIQLTELNTAMLLDKVTSALKLQLKKLILEDPAFSNLGRSQQGLEFHRNRIVNRHDKRSIVLGIPGFNNTIKPGADKTMGNETLRGFAVYQADGGSDCFYRNYDFREAIDLEVDEPLRILHMDDGTMKLLRTNDSEIKLALLD